MNFEKEDSLIFEHLAGGNIIEKPPIYASTGEHLLFLSGDVINVYSTTTGQLVRKLEGATTPLADYCFELDNEDVIVACSQSGEILSWSWQTGELKGTVKLDVGRGLVTNFQILNLWGNSQLPYAFMCMKIAGAQINWRLVDRVEGRFVPIPCDLKLSMKAPLMSVDTKNFPNLVLVQGFYVFFVNYKTWTWKRFMNAHKVPITVLQKHPSEDCFATGDETGKIFLWREFTSQTEVKTSLYHWHHTKVTSIYFTVSGANFFSSGDEAVLVKWNVKNPEYKQFLPRMSAKIQHIVVSPDNSQIAVCTVDNGVQIVGTENKVLSNLQEFTYIVDDKTGNSKFPVGLRLNPRTNTLVLNGRTGSLQFYNTYTKNLLYNLNIVNQNQLSTESDRILYDISVTKAAFNIDWLATGEVFNDQEHLPELRLKFWKFQEESQRYALNTNIELPHEGGFKAIEFSNDYQVDNLLCATVGEDNVIKMWCLDDSDSIYKDGKSWFCIAQTSYRNLPVDSISFSQDGSLLAAGYGNTLCIYKSDDLKLKAALTGANGMDGCVSKAQVRIPSKNMNGSRNDLKEKRDKLMKLFSNMLDMNEETLIKELQKTVVHDKKKKSDMMDPVGELDDKQKTALYTRILQLHELNLFQKVMIYQKLGIGCKVHPQIAAKFADYIHNTVKERRKEKRAQLLHTELHRLNKQCRFKAKYRLDQYVKRQRTYDTTVSNNLVPLLSLLNLSHNTTQTPISNGSAAQASKSPKVNNEKVIPPKSPIAEIRHVQFAAGEYGHLVAVCTERRILIWNLLTLRLQSVLKLSVKHFTFDAQTNLMAVVTTNDELHIFQPNVPLPIYQRHNIPQLHGMAWIPRRYPKQRSINLDWQAQSTLYFLTDDQKIVYLSSPTEKEADVPTPIVFNNFASETMRYSTFGTYAVKSNTEKQISSRQSGPLVLGNADKTAVKALIDMSTHTMPPMSLMCEDFLKSMVRPVASPAVSRSQSNTIGDDDDGGGDALATRLNGDGITNGFGGAHSDDEDDMNGDIKMTNGSSSPATNASASNIRKDLMRKTEELKHSHKIKCEDQNAPANDDVEETKLRFLAKQHINLEF
ncbi:WD repeat-containing protein l(2)05287 [Haematobia irritans]|uniref:WD repeat-containing protein l(2)05287 n=1 Tax=Haematobia irritans TaxID=7368 RepID=UPI003F4F9335